MASKELLDKQNLCDCDEEGETAKPCTQPLCARQDRSRGSEPSDQTVTAVTEMKNDMDSSNVADEYPYFGYRKVLLTCASIGLFYFDIVTDVLLAKDYYNQENMLAFGLTAAFIIGPSLVICFLNFRWYFSDYQENNVRKNGENNVSENEEKNVKVTSWNLWFVRFAMTISMMGPVIRQIEYMYNGIKSRSPKLSKVEKERYFLVMQLENVDACSVRMFECFLEAAPQLVLQIYILLAHIQDEPWLTATIRGAAILSSWLSLSWSMMAFTNSLRACDPFKQNMEVPGMILCFLWRACEIGPRVIALGLFWSRFNYLVFIIVGAHWVLMTSWSSCAVLKSETSSWGEKFFFTALFGYVLVFCFLDVHGGRTMYRMILFYMIMYLENWSMMGFWFYFTPDKSEWFYLPAFFIVSLSIFVHLFFQVTYYACFHPTNDRCRQCCMQCCNFVENFVQNFPSKESLCNHHPKGVAVQLLCRKSKKKFIKEQITEQRL